VTVVQVVPSGSDPHSFEPPPSLVRAVAKSKVLFANGLSLEPFFEKLEAQLPPSARVLEQAEGMPYLIEVQEAQPGEHHHRAYDPHLWLDPNYGIRYVERIRDTLIRVGPAGRASYTQNAARYFPQICLADAEVQRCSVFPELGASWFRSVNRWATSIATTGSAASAQSPTLAGRKGAQPAWLGWPSP